MISISRTRQEFMASAGGSQSSGIASCVSAVGCPVLAFIPPRAGRARKHGLAGFFCCSCKTCKVEKGDGGGESAQQLCRKRRWSRYGAKSTPRDSSFSLGLCWDFVRLDQDGWTPM
jgi:hypothetical protein